MHPVQDKLNLERDEISGAGWILSRPTIRRSDDKSQRFSRKISSVTTCSTLLQISLKLCQKMREKKDLVKNKIASYSKRTNSSKNGELAARNSQLAWTFNKRSSRWKPQTNLQQRIRLKSGRHASATIFFFCFEREKKEENINLQPCGLRILFSFSEDYETENIRIRRMVFLVVICTNKRKWTIERISRGKFSQQSVNQLFRRAFEEWQNRVCGYGPNHRIPN